MADGKVCYRSVAVVSPEEAAGQQMRVLPGKQSVGPELGSRQAEGVIRKWQVCPSSETVFTSRQSSSPLHDRSSSSLSEHNLHTVHL